MKPTVGYFQRTPGFQSIGAATHGRLHDLELEKLHEEIGEFQQLHAGASPICEMLRNTLDAKAPSLDFSGWQDIAEIKAMQALPPKLIESIVAYRGARFTATQWKISWPAQEKFALPEWFASVPDWLSLLDINRNVEPFDVGGNKEAENYSFEWDKLAHNTYAELKSPAQQSIIDVYNTKLATEIILPKNGRNESISLSEFVLHAKGVVEDLHHSNKRTELRVSFAIDNGYHSVPLTYIRSPHQSCWIIFDSLGTIELREAGRKKYTLPTLAKLRDVSNLPVYLVVEKSQIGHGCRIHTIAVGKALTRIEADGSYSISTEQLLLNAKPIKQWDKFFSLDLPAELLVFAQTRKFVDAHRGATAKSPVRRRNSGRRPADLGLSDFFARHQNPTTNHKDYLRRKGLRTTLLARMHYYAANLRGRGIPWSDGLTRAFYRQAKTCLRSAESGHCMSLGQEADTYNLMHSALALDNWLAHHEIIPPPRSQKIAPDSIEWKSMLNRSLANTAGVLERQLTFDLGMQATDVLSREQICGLFQLGARHASKDEILSLAKLIPWDRHLLKNLPPEMLTKPSCSAIGPILDAIEEVPAFTCGLLLFVAISDANEKAISTIFKIISKFSEIDQEIVLCGRIKEGKTALGAAFTGEIELSVASAIIAGVGSTVQDPLTLANILEVALDDNFVGHRILAQFDELVQIFAESLSGRLDQNEFENIWEPIERKALLASSRARKLSEAISFLARNANEPNMERFYAGSIMAALRRKITHEAEALFEDMAYFQTPAVEALWQFEDDSENLLIVALRSGPESIAATVKNFLKADFSPLIKAKIFWWANASIINPQEKMAISETINRLRTDLTRLIDTDVNLSLDDRDRALKLLA